MTPAVLGRWSGAASPHSVIAEIVDPDCVAGRAGSVTGQAVLPRN